MSHSSQPLLIRALVHGGDAAVLRELADGPGRRCSRQRHRCFAASGVTALLLLVLATSSSGYGGQSETMATLQITENWTVMRGTYHGKPIITRFNLGLRPLIGHPRFSKQLGIAVPFNHPTDHGLPQPRELRDLDAIEDEIGKQFSDVAEYVLAGVITYNNMREFVVYTANPMGAVAKAKALSDTMRGHQIQFELHDDPGWENFKRFHSMNERGTEHLRP
jgi:hypothetical protein